jgi:hypothetical protein
LAAANANMSFIVERSPPIPASAGQSQFATGLPARSCPLTR